jgi:hypothetical protein
MVLNGSAVRNLDDQATVEDAKAELGMPWSESSIGMEQVLVYRNWLLVFSNGRLERRTLELPVVRKARVTAKDMQQIPQLERGMTVAEVEHRLGLPESHSEVLEGQLPPQTVLGYGPWELKFEGGKLVTRTRY